MLLGYGYSWLATFGYAIAVPTGAALTSHLVQNARLAGVLVATFSFGAALTQPLQGVAFSTLELRTVYLLYCVIFTVGCALVIVALPVGSAALLFGGRFVMGFTAGNQLFAHILERDIFDAEQRVQALRVDAAVMQAALSSGYFVSSLLLYFMVGPSGEPIRFDGAALQVSTVPYLFGAVAALALLVWAATSFRPRPWSHEAHRAPAASAAGVPTLPDVLVAFACLFVYSAVMGYKMVVLFVFESDRWRYGLTGASLFATVVELVGVLTVPFDTHVLSRHGLVRAIGFASALLTLGVAPWHGLSRAASTWLYAVSAVLLTTLTRIGYSSAGAHIMHYAQQPGVHRVRWVVASGFIFELALGTGGVLASVVEGPAGAVAIAVGMLACAALRLVDWS